jgi:hypothetical protein
MTVSSVSSTAARCSRRTVRNGLKIGDEPITHAHDRSPLNEELRTLFPDRPFYIYSYGSLVPLQDRPLFTTEVLCTHIAGSAPRDQQGTSR